MRCHYTESNIPSSCVIHFMPKTHSLAAKYRWRS